MQVNSNIFNIVPTMPVITQKALTEKSMGLSKLLSCNQEYVAKFKAGETNVMDRLSGSKRLVDITKEQEHFTIAGKDHYYTKFNMFADGEKIGYLTAIPDFFHGLTKTIIDGYGTLQNELIYKVSTLCSIGGDRCRGIGSQLLKVAIQQSKKEGYDGKLFLEANNFGDIAKVSYRGEASPVDFYKNFGFEFVNKQDKMNRYMYLPNQKRLEYLLELLEKPILYK